MECGGGGIESSELRTEAAESGEVRTEVGDILIAAGDDCMESGDFCIEFGDDDGVLAVNFGNGQITRFNHESAFSDLGINNFVIDFLKQQVG